MPAELLYTLPVLFGAIALLMRRNVTCFIMSIVTISLGIALTCVSYLPQNQQDGVLTILCIWLTIFLAGFIVFIASGEKSMEQD